jgi:hypothetical protein
MVAAVVPRLPRKVIIFLVIVVIGTIAAVVTTAMPPTQPREAPVTTTGAP